MNRDCWLGQVCLPPSDQSVGLTWRSWRTTTGRSCGCSTSWPDVTIVGQPSSTRSCFCFQSKILPGPGLELSRLYPRTLMCGGNCKALPATTLVLWQLGAPTTATRGRLNLAPLALQDGPVASQSNHQSSWFLRSTYHVLLFRDVEKVIWSWGHQRQSTLNTWYQNHSKQLPTPFISPRKRARRAKGTLYFCWRWWGREWLLWWVSEFLLWWVSEWLLWMRVWERLL